MIKIENGEVTAEGSSPQLIKEWYVLTQAIIKGLSKEMNTHVDIEVMIEGAEMLIDDEIREKNSSGEKKVIF